jgi:hypothetical protein
VPWKTPAKILDQLSCRRHGSGPPLVKLRQAVATAIASQKRIQNAGRAGRGPGRPPGTSGPELALTKGEEDLARAGPGPAQDLPRTPPQPSSTQLQGQAGQVDQLKAAEPGGARKAESPRPRPKKTCSRPAPRRARGPGACGRAPVGSLGANTARWRPSSSMEEKVAGPRGPQPGRRRAGRGRSGEPVRRPRGRPRGRRPSWRPSGATRRCGPGRAPPAGLQRRQHRGARHRRGASACSTDPEPGRPLKRSIDKLLSRMANRRMAARLAPHSHARRSGLFSASVATFTDASFQAEVLEAPRARCWWMRAG